MVVFYHRSTEPEAYSTGRNKARLTLRIESGAAKRVFVAFADRYDENGSGYEEMMHGGNDGTWDYFDVYVVQPTGRLKYVFYVELLSESVWFGENGVHQEQAMVDSFQLAYLTERDNYEVPDWVKTAIAYEIFPDRFARSHPQKAPPGCQSWNSAPTPTTLLGGTLIGIHRYLPYLADLGVTLIYLTPIFRSPSNHKYDTSDYFDIDPQFGSKADLRDLVREAHKLGMRVILDAVFNHCGDKFAHFQEVVQAGKGSPYWNWFFIRGDKVNLDEPNFETFANGIASMPKLNVAHDQVERYLLDVATYWIRECDIDGWRLDVANEVDHVFWRKFRAAVKETKPDALIIGEVWHDSLPWLRGDQFDGVMNYIFRSVVLQHFVRKTLPVQEFAQAITRLLHQYPQPANAAMFNLLGSHDTARVLTEAGGKVERVIEALVFQFTYPGIPMVYYGDEVGMTGSTDPDCRKGMEWNKKRQNKKIKDIVRRLATLKASLPALAIGELKFIEANEKLLLYQRTSEDETCAVNVVMNRDGQPYALSPHALIHFATSSETWQSGRVPRNGVAIWQDC